MRSSRLSLCGSVVRAAIFILFLLLQSVVYARVKPVGFQIPSRIFSLGRAATPREYAQLRQAIKANWEKDKARVLQSGPPLGSSFVHITATRIRLGALGQAMVVYFAHSPQCGATGNCPMAIYVRVPNGYRRVISSGGWGYALLPSGAPVPDVAFYWNMSAGESYAKLFHYTDGKFVPTRTVVCNGKNSSAICTAMGSTLQATNEAISPAEYDALRPLIESDLEKHLPALARRYSFDDAHAVRIAIGLGPCGYNRNCRIWVYGRNYRNPKNENWLMLSNVTGWGIGSSRFRGASHMGGALVIARRLSANEDELTRYYTPPQRPVPGPISVNLPESVSASCAGRLGEGVADRLPLL